MGSDGSVSLKKTRTLPSVDEKLGEEEGSHKERMVCRKYIGQMMWLTTRTRPDISVCLGMLSSLMVRRPKQVKAHLVDLWRYLWTISSHTICTLPSPKAPQTLLQKDDERLKRARRS